MFGKVDAQPWGVSPGSCDGICGKPVQRHPAGVRDLGRIGDDAQARTGLSDENLDLFILGQPVSHIGPVFDHAAGNQRDAGDAQFFPQPALCAPGRRLAPHRMRAAGVGPQSRRVILARRPPLQQHPVAIQHEDRHRLVPQPTAMHLKLLDRHKLTVVPGRNQRGHTCSGETRRVRCARFFNPIFRCAIGRARTSFLFM